MGWASFGVWLYYIWEILQDLRGYSPLLASAQNAPAAVTGFVAAIVTGALIGNQIPIPYIMILALTAYCITPVLSAIMPINQTYWAQTSVPKEHQGVAASLVLTVANYSISMGLGIAGTVVVETDKSGTDLLKEFRSAFYTSIGLAGLGLAITVVSAGYYKRHPLAIQH
ncbi:hypothetical protein MMC13_000435 [Lambiella insularis]|nr:hypothetical protein [Lambiella insularis]